jgi:hypothetical protein
MNSPLVIVAIIALVALAAWAMRRASSDGETVQMPEGSHADDDPAAEEADVGEGDDEHLAVTSDGAVFVPDGHAVRVVPLGEPEAMAAHREDIEAGLIAMSASGRLQLAGFRGPGGGKGGTPLNAGDFTGARMKRGAAGSMPWRLETLGRDGDYGFYPFETEEGARAALAMLEKRDIVRALRDEDGRPIPASSEDFEEARRRYDETEQALALEPDTEDEAR